MQPIVECQKVEMEQGAFYFGTSNEKYSEGYLELKPHSSLTLHNRATGIEHLTQIEGKSSMIIYGQPDGEIVTLNKGDKHIMDPAGVWHIHCNPYDQKCLQHWYFKGDIRHVIEKIKKEHE